MKTFQEFLLQRDKLLAEANEVKHLRSTLVHVMGLDDAISSKTGEDIPLEQLNLDDIKKKLEGWSLWQKLPEKSREAAEDMLRAPQNQRLADLLDTLGDQPMNLGSVTTQDDNPSPVQTMKPNPQ